jgi:hypothetical protein
VHLHVQHLDPQRVSRRRAADADRPGHAVEVRQADRLDRLAGGQPVVGDVARLEGDRVARVDLERRWDRRIEADLERLGGQRVLGHRRRI